MCTAQYAMPTILSKSIETLLNSRNLVNLRPARNNKHYTVLHVNPNTAHLLLAAATASELLLDGSAPVTLPDKCPRI